MLVQLVIANVVGHNFVDADRFAICGILSEFSLKTEATHKLKSLNMKVFPLLFLVPVFPNLTKGVSGKVSCQNDLCKYIPVLKCTQLYIQQREFPPLFLVHVFP